MPIENNKISTIKAMDCPFSQTNDDKTIDVPKNNVIKKSKNCECCYYYGPDTYKFNSCICCKPYKKYCCFIIFLAYFWLGILYILLYIFIILLYILAYLCDYIIRTNISNCLKINIGF